MPPSLVWDVPRLKKRSTPLDNSVDSSVDISVDKIVDKLAAMLIGKSFFDFDFCHRTRRRQTQLAPAIGKGNQSPTAGNISLRLWKAF